MDLLFLSMLVKHINSVQSSKIHPAPAELRRGPGEFLKSELVCCQDVDNDDGVT
jgi:hypothetical protein